MTPATSWSMRIAFVLAVAGTVVGPRPLLMRPANAGVTCVGDCDGNGAVSIDELIVAVNIGTGRFPVTTCPRSDSNADDSVGIDDVLLAVNSSLTICEPPAGVCSLSDDIFRCAVDADCEVAGVGCCPCFHPTAVNTTAHGAIALNQRYCCAGVHCPHKPCLKPEIRPVCDQGRCAGIPLRMP